MFCQKNLAQANGKIEDLAKLALAESIADLTKDEVRLSLQAIQEEALAADAGGLQHALQGISFPSLSSICCLSHYATNRRIEFRNSGDRGGVRVPPFGDQEWRHPRRNAAGFRASHTLSKVYVSQATTFVARHSLMIYFIKQRQPVRHRPLPGRDGFSHER